MANEHQKISVEQIVAKHSQVIDDLRDLGVLDELAESVQQELLAEIKTAATQAIVDAYGSDSISSEDLWDAAYPDGDPHADYIRVHPDGSATWVYGDGTSTEYEDSGDALSGECVAPPYDDGDDWVYEAADSDMLAKEAVDRLL